MKLFTFIYQHTIDYNGLAVFDPVRIDLLTFSGCCHHNVGQLAL
jgi:hypothetical protein